MGIAKVPSPETRFDGGAVGCRRGTVSLYKEFQENVNSQAYIAQIEIGGSVNGEKRVA